MAKTRLQGYVEEGGGVAVANLSGSPINVERAFPLATVSVYLAGTLTPATTYRDAAGTSLPNPFTADANAYWFVYLDPGTYDITFSGSGITIPFTLSSIVVSATSLFNPFVVAPAPSGGDDFSTLQALINTNIPLGLDIRLRLGTYIVLTELTSPASVGASRLIGTPPQGRNVSGTIIRAGTLGMRSVFAPSTDSLVVEGVCFDAAAKSTNAVYLNTTNWMTWQKCSLLNAVKHGLLNNAASGDQGHTFEDCYFGNNGTLYVSAGLAASFTYGTRTTVAGTATTNSGVALVTFAGLAIDLTTIAAKDDFLIVGAALATAQIMLISSVTATTITVQANIANLPSVTAAAQAFAIGSGDGVREDIGGAVGVNLYTNCRFSGSGGSGIRMGGLYGSKIIAGQADFNNLFGVSIGRADNVSAAALAPSIDGLYLEANFGSAGLSYFLGGATGLSITPAPSGAASMTTGGALLATGTINYGSGQESIQSGISQNALVEFRNVGGQLQHRIVAEHWDGFAPLEFDRVVANTTAWTNTPTLDATHGFTTGVGVYDVGGVLACALDTVKAQNTAPFGDVPIEFNSTGVAYTAQLTTDTVNINGVTRVRLGIYLTTLGGVLTSINTTTIADTKSIGFRVSVKIR